MRKYLQITDEGKVLDNFYSHLKKGEPRPKALKLFFEEAFENVLVGEAKKLTGHTWLFRYD